MDDGESVAVAKAILSFSPWLGEKPTDTYGGKAILDFHGRPAFAELAILWSFIDAGWEGVWIDSYRTRYLRKYWPSPVPEILPPEREELLRAITDRAAGRARPWDVFCWSPSGMVFAEAKKCRHDSIRKTQTAFLAAAVGFGVPVSSFLLVEWSAD